MVEQQAFTQAVYQMDDLFESLANLHWILFLC